MPLRMRTQEKANRSLYSPLRSQQCQIMQPKKSQFVPVQEPGSCANPPVTLEVRAHFGSCAVRQRAQIIFCTVHHLFNMLEMGKAPPWSSPVA